MYLSRTPLPLLVCLLTLPTALDAQQPEQPLKQLNRINTTPVYIRNTNYDKKWYEVLKTGINTTRKYLGNYGPTFVYIIGHTDNELNDKQQAQRIIDAYCANRSEGDPKRNEHCRKEKGADLIQRAIAGNTEAYLSYVGYIENPIAELVFINPHQFPMPYLYTRGIHEYTHVYQRGFKRTPTWMTEGGAEFLAFYLGDKHDWIDFQESMRKSLRMIEQVPAGDATMRDFEDVEKLEVEAPEKKRYYRHLAYDAGVWAVAYLISRSKSKSTKAYFKRFYPLVEKYGWQPAIQKYSLFHSTDEFYKSFEEFLNLEIGEKMLLLEQIRP